MGYLIENGECDIVPIPGTDGATVTLKRQATFDDELAVDAAMPQGASRTEFWRCYVPARTMVMIESWTLKDADGAPLPITDEVLAKRLSRPVASFIAIEARRRFDGGAEGSEGPFGTGSQPPSTDGEPTTPKP